MDVNPYQPPTVLGDALVNQQPDPTFRPRRPVGIWILAGLHLVVGLLLLAIAILTLYQLIASDRWIGTQRNVLWFVTIAGGVMAALGLSSSAGLWRGARWGWWIATFYYVWAVLGVIADSLMLIPSLSQHDGESLALSIARKVVQLVIHALLLAYLFKRNVLAFFQLQSLRIDRAMIPLVILAVILLAATYFFTSTQLAGAF